MNKYGEALYIRELKEIDESTLAEKLYKFINELDLEVGNFQEKSWEECIKYLKHTFEGMEQYDDFMIAFEYWIPFSCYRRPDVIMFYNDIILVLEFKRKNISLDIDKHQLRGYLNELRNNHQVTHSSKEKLKILGCLVVTEAEDSIYHENGIDIIEGNKLRDYLNRYKPQKMSKYDAYNWLDSQHMPLLDIIQATTEMFINGNIPEIKNIEEGVIKKARNIILNQINNKINEKKIFFLTGVPGAGKTLILVYLIYLLNNFKEKEYIKALYTSGNAPLISTLSYILSKDKSVLEGKSFMKDIKDIKGYLFDKKSNKAREEVNTYPTICFDEAQRAWDLNHMKKYNFHVSEPELLLILQNKAYLDHNNANIVCSYGEGQSIYLGEESGFEIWSDVLNRREYEDWIVYCPRQLYKHFKNRKNTKIIEELYLDTSIRGDFVDLVPLINSILNVDYKAAKEQVHDIIRNGFEIKVTRDFDKIKNHIKDYEKQHNNKFYGMVTSSNASTGTFEALIPDFKKILSQKDNERIGKWYIEDCNRLEEAAAEFGCQGLELNIPIVLFGRDYIIKDSKWEINQKLWNKAKSDRNFKKVLQYENPKEIFNNIYRVILSRGRKGMLLFIPNTKDLHETYKFFKSIGIEDIN